MRTLRERIQWVPPAEVIPVDIVYAGDVRHEIVKESLKEMGWQGRPILAFLSDDKDPEGRDLVALTGSHRIQAARGVVPRIPVVLLTEKEKEAIFDEPWALFLDPDLKIWMPENLILIEESLRRKRFRPVADLLLVDRLVHELPEEEPLWSPKMIERLKAGLHREVIDILRV